MTIVEQNPCLAGPGARPDALSLAGLPDNVLVVTFPILPEPHENRASILGGRRMAGARRVAEIGSRREIAGFSELLEWFLAQRGKRIRGFRKALYSGVTTRTMASRIIPRLIEDFPKLSGRFQIAGPVISKYDLLCQLRDAFSLDVTIDAEEGFHCDRTLQSQRFAEATGMVMPGWPEMLADLAADQDFYEKR